MSISNAPARLAVGASYGVLLCAISFPVSVSVSVSLAVSVAISVAISSAAVSEAAASPLPLTLEEALARAARRPSVELAAKAAEAAGHEGEQAAQLAYSPELAAAVGPRWVAGQREVELQLGLAQTFELGGKRAARRGVAGARRELAEVDLAAARKQARAEAWRAFQLALLARERVGMAREAEQVAQQVEMATRERQKLGFATQLELNLTTAELGRARHDQLDAQRKDEEARARLASAIGARPDEELELRGELAPPPPLAAETGEVLARALRERPEARAARAGEQLAAAEVRAADAAAVPDLQLGISYGYERDPEATAQSVLATVAIGLPLWNRNRGGRKAARIQAERAAIAQRWTAAEIEREVRLTVAGYQRAREAVLGFDREVNERLHENLELARESYTSGKIDYFQFNVVRRELLASRNAYLDAVEETVEAWAAVQQAAGAEGMQ